MNDKEIGTEISMWLPDGMVDVVDSKSTARKGVRVRVSGEPPLYKLIIFNKDKTINDTAKTLIAGLISLNQRSKNQFQDFIGISSRIKNNEIYESELFFLKSFIPKIFVMREKSFKFTSMRLP